MTLGILLAYALVGIFVLIVLPGFLYWMIASAIRWPAHIRDVLAREGFTVRHLERRWFTRGPFPDKIEQNPDLKKMLDQPGVRELMQKQQRDRDVLQVVKITTGCEDPTLL